MKHRFVCVLAPGQSVFGTLDGEHTYMVKQRKKVKGERDPQTKRVFDASGR
jgi:hypothetical protein